MCRAGGGGEIGSIEQGWSGRRSSSSLAFFLQGSEGWGQRRVQS